MMTTVSAHARPRRPRQRARTGALLAATLLLGACSRSGRAGRDVATTSVPTTVATDITAAPDTTAPGDGATRATTVTGRPVRTVKPYDDDVRRAVRDIESYWSAELPKIYGRRYRPLAKGLFAYSADSVIPPCGGEKLPYPALQDNAFYCPDDDFIAWDDQKLFPELSEQFGNFTIATVLAHEWGHAIQARSDVDTGSLPTALAEQQADCFAGAWVAHLDEMGDKALSRRPSNLDQVLAGFIRFRDFLGVSANDPGAHGSAFDRIRAFQEGFESGAARCAAYIDEPPTLVELPFDSARDRFTGGNVRFDRVLPISIGALTTFWKESADAEPVNVVETADATRCPSKAVSVQTVRRPAMRYCAATNTIVWDREVTQALYDRFGDFGVATVLSQHWGIALEQRDGIDLGTLAARLRVDCLTGAWAGATFRSDYTDAPSLSPGDLDEAVQVFLSLGAPERGANPRFTGMASSFQQVDAFRTGFFGAVGDCPN